MPFKSEAQRRFMFAKHPNIAQRWSKESPNQGPLPMHVREPKVNVWGEMLNAGAPNSKKRMG